MRVYAKSDGVLTYRAPGLERLKDICVLFAGEHYAMQMADAEDLFQTAYLDALLESHGSWSSRLSLSEAAVLIFRERLVESAATQRRDERRLHPMSGRLLAPVRDDPAVQAQRDGGRAIRSYLSYLVGDLWAGRLEQLLDGESIAALAQASFVSSSCVHKIVERLRIGMRQHRERLARLLQ